MFDATLRFDPDIRNAEDLLTVISAKLHVDVPKIERSQKPSKSDLPAHYFVAKKKILLGNNFDGSNQAHLYVLLHEFSHHVADTRLAQQRKAAFATEMHGYGFTVALSQVLLTVGKKFVGVCEYETVKKDLEILLLRAGRQDIVPDYRFRNECPISMRPVAQASIRKPKIQVLPTIMLKDFPGYIGTVKAKIVYQLKKLGVLHYYIIMPDNKKMMISSNDEHIVTG